LTLLLLSLACAACSPNHEANVRERARQLIVHLLQEDYAACAELADPDFVRQYGLKGAEIRFRILGAFAKLGNVTEDRVKIDTITVDSEANTATVNIQVQFGEEWKPIDSQRWVRKDNEWYLAL
jgi:hypothetical protein